MAPFLIHSLSQCFTSLRYSNVVRRSLVDTKIRTVLASSCAEDQNSAVWHTGSSKARTTTLHSRTITFPLVESITHFRRVGRFLMNNMNSPFINALQAHHVTAVVEDCDQYVLHTSIHPAYERCTNLMF